ncbi:single-stranded DNA-binding protein [soil metagenome]
MSRSLNKAIIIGNLGSDPEIRTTAGGTRVANFSVATGRTWTGRDGQQQEKTEWHRIVAWEKLADIAEKFLKKGERVYIEGEIEYGSYQDKDGVTKYTTDIRAREMIMLGSGGGSAGGDFGGGGRERAAAQSGARNQQTKGDDFNDFPDIGGDEDDLPF